MPRAINDIEVFVSITNPNNNSPLNIYGESNGENLISLLNILSSSGSQTFSFKYKPEYNQVPSISVRASSANLNITSINSLSAQICNCTNVDKNATCLTDQVQATISSTVQILACSCSSAYSGLFCEQAKDWCTISGSSICNTTNQNCFNLPPNQQTLSQKYVCCSYGFDSLNGLCLAKVTTSSPVSSSDSTTLALQIALPIIAFLIVLIFTLFVVYFITK